MTLPRNTVAPAPPPAVNGDALRGLHQSLFGCAPEALDKLMPGERVPCLAALPKPDLDATNNVLILPSRAKDPRHWQRALARKQNPLLLPCMSPVGLAITPLIILCLTKGAIGGFGDLDEEPGYGEPPPIQLRVPNNGEPREEPAFH